MKHLRTIFSLMLLAAFVLLGGRNVHASFVQTQRDQIAIYILVNVTPAPVGYLPEPSPQQVAAVPMSMRVRLRAKGSGDFDDVPNLHLTDGMVAQATTQSDVRVQAQVTPNPNGTMLYSNMPTVNLNQTAGTTVTTKCAYTVTVDTTQSAWTLYDGLSNDFKGSAFPGKDLENNTYLQAGTPNPQATPFVVYSDNNNQWATATKSSLAHSYCVDLVLTIPSSVPGGAYSSNAIYTLYF